MFHCENHHQISGDVWVQSRVVYTTTPRGKFAGRKIKLNVQKDVVTRLQITAETVA